MTREEVLTLLPEIKLIHSTDLQEKSITCWQQVLELGGWDKKGVDKAPLAAGIGGRQLSRDGYRSLPPGGADVPAGL